MKVVSTTLGRYESPQVTIVQLVTEQSVLTGSSNSILDDMFETDGEWAAF